MSQTLFDLDVIQFVHLVRIHSRTLRQGDTPLIVEECIKQLNQQNLGSVVLNVEPFNLKKLGLQTLFIELQNRGIKKI